MLIYLSRKYKKMLLLALCGFLIFSCAAVVSEAPDSVRIPIIMYHHISKDHSLGDYVITPSELEEDLNTIRQQGYQTIVMQDLIDFVNTDAPLPERPILLTFDDGNLSNYLYAYPLLKQYGMKAVISIVGEYVDRYTQLEDENENYAYLQWKHVKEMSDSGVIEIQNHSYDLHKNNRTRQGIRKNNGEDMESYRKMLSSDVLLLQEKCRSHLGIVPTTFTYPFGFGAKDAQSILQECGFVATLSCAEGVSLVTKGDPNSLWNLKRYNRPHQVDRTRFFAKLSEN